MSILGGKNGYIEKNNDHLLLVFTNTEVDTDKAFKNWWAKEFPDLKAIPGLSKPLHLKRDKDQRPGHCPYWKYMMAFGFKGDVRMMRDAVQAHVPNGDTVLWFFEAFAPLYNRKWDPKVKEEHIFMALTNPVPGRAADYNEWYNEHHVKDIVQIDPYMSGRRFHRIAYNGHSPYEYIAFYRFLGPEVKMHKKLMDYIDTHDIAETDAYELNDLAWVYSAL